VSISSFIRVIPINLKKNHLNDDLMH